MYPPDRASIFQHAITIRLNTARLLSFSKLYLDLKVLCLLFVSGVSSNRLKNGRKRNFIQNWDRPTAKVKL